MDGKGYLWTLMPIKIGINAKNKLLSKVVCEDRNKIIIDIERTFILGELPL